VLCFSPIDLRYWGFNRTMIWCNKFGSLCAKWIKGYTCCSRSKAFYSNRLAIKLRFPQRNHPIWSELKNSHHRCSGILEANWLRLWNSFILACEFVYGLHSNSQKGKTSRRKFIPDLIAIWNWFSLDQVRTEGIESRFSRDASWKLTTLFGKKSI